MVPYPSIRADESSGPSKAAHALQEEAINTVSSLFLRTCHGLQVAGWKSHGFHLRKKESGVGGRGEGRKVHVRANVEKMLQETTI